MSLAVQFHAAVASLTGLLVPLSSAAIAQADGARLRALYERSLRLALALVVLFAVGAVAAGPAFLAAWMGAAFAERAGGGRPGEPDEPKKEPRQPIRRSGPARPWAAAGTRSTFSCAPWRRDSRSGTTRP